MSGVRARRVRRNKALAWMYCPRTGTARDMGPLAPYDVLLRSYYRRVAHAMREQYAASMALFKTIKPTAGTRRVTFPVEVG